MTDDNSTPKQEADKLEENKSETKSEVANHKLRDEHGHFIKKAAKTSGSETDASAKKENPVSKFFSDHTHHSKTQDDLLDVRIGNPLNRITKLLEDIKKQKAFNFTLKGSLGIMGVFLALSVFGIFGGGQILCDKGTQVEIGTVKQLQVLEEDPISGIPVLSQIVDYFRAKQMRQKFVLIKSDESVIQLPYSSRLNLASFVNYRVIAAGKYDACSKTLTVSDPGGIEAYYK